MKWRDDILAKKDSYNKTIINGIFMKPEILHYTIIQLPMATEASVEACRKMMKDMEPTIQNMIAQRGVNGKLKLPFDKLDTFGDPQNTRVIFMKLKDSGD